MIFSMTVDPKLDAKVKGIGKALSKAAAFTLTDSAAYAKADLLVAIKQKVDRPTPFTLNPSGYKVVIARIGSDLNTMSSEMNIAPKQSAYEKFIFYFGPRHLGDAGASQKHIWVPGQRQDDGKPGSYSISAKRSSYGGVPNSYSQYLYELWQTQKRTWFSTKGHMGSGKYSTGGVFYGTIKGARQSSSPGRSAPHHSAATSWLVPSSATSSPSPCISAAPTAASSTVASTMPRSSRARSAAAKVQASSTAACRWASSSPTHRRVTTRSSTTSW
jgi:hypothetical protein